ncbi:uncharacterized protein [Littorina saxatilis]|uniref:uncharacterized protein isoform X2 n=1 Tax=Littorina saxatilis TaxID=31220 RepID=UPI0038B69563
MLGLLLLAFVTTLTVLLACDLSGRVNSASGKLMLTCECRGPRDDTHDVTRIHSLMISEERQQKILAKLEDGRLKVDKYARKNRVVDHFISEKQDRALLTLAFSRHRKYDFKCTVMGRNRTGPVYLSLKFMYNPKDYSTRTPPPPPPTTTTTTEPTTTEATEAIITTTTTTTTEAIRPAATTTASTTASASSTSSQENVLLTEGQATGDHSSSGRSSHASYTQTIERRTTTKLPTTKTTGTTSTDTPEINHVVPTDDKSEKFTQIMIIIVSVFAFFSAAVLAVSILGMVRRESTATARHTSCTDAIPWDLLMNFLTATTSQGRAGQKHVTSSPPYSIDSESDTMASGSYAMCLTDMSSLDDVDRDDAGHPFLPNDDVTSAQWTDDVSTPTSPKRIIFENELSYTSDTDDASDSYSVSVSSMSRTNMPTSAMGIIGEHSLPTIRHSNRDSTPTLLDHREPPSLGQRSRAPCLHHHRRDITCDRERPCIQAAPSSQQQRGPSIETTSRHLPSELSLPAQGGYVDDTAS